MILYTHKTFKFYHGPADINLKNEMIDSMDQTLESDSIDPAEPFAYRRTLARLESRLLDLDLKAKFLEISLKHKLVGSARNELQSASSLE
jgi:hypothetical protein